MKYELVLTDALDDEIFKAIVAPLVAYNDSQVGPSQHRGLAVLMRDDTGVVVGGLWGQTSYEWLFTQMLVVPNHLRGQGIGTKVVQIAEQEALERGCKGAWVDTFEFQARTFYELMGYVCFGEIPNHPFGFSRFFMKKEFTRSPHQAAS
jgi:GNAT superfamily N-acetyltransferase